jgi:hypothetical protein
MTSSDRLQKMSISELNDEIERLKQLNRSKSYVHRVTPKQQVVLYYDVDRESHIFAQPLSGLQTIVDHLTEMTEKGPQAWRNLKYAQGLLVDRFFDVNQEQHIFKQSISGLREIVEELRARPAPTYYASQNLIYARKLLRERSDSELQEKNSAIDTVHERRRSMTALKEKAASALLALEQQKLQVDPNRAAAARVAEQLAAIEARRAAAQRAAATGRARGRL